MNQNGAVERIFVIMLDAFLAVTALAGGIGLLTGAVAPPPELLMGSAFDTYAIPGLVLLVIVGGSALAAAGLMLWRHRLGAPASFVAGIMIMGFEMVEVFAIGSPPGIARNLQIFYFTMGLLMVILAIRLPATEATVSVSG